MFNELPEPYYSIHKGRVYLKLNRPKQEGDFFSDMDFAQARFECARFQIDQRGGWDAGEPSGVLDYNDGEWWDFIKG